jgi:hypothetical protein
MALIWKAVTAAHVAGACDLVAGGSAAPRANAKGIFVLRDGKRLPAKHVLRLAHCMTDGLPLKRKITFSSGEGTTNRLRALGFDVEYTKAAKPKA